ncbi:Hypothetical predicted protein [Marmota monax]|uniref:28S ribosomal protein S25, mitochondrial n=1 Tax=Marmota monax TaxID=9995 RepID=A0A5E4CWZ6_MARMO|nr:Hypothetical predicted protein [Marmota monax]
MPTFTLLYGRALSGPLTQVVWGPPRPGRWSALTPTQVPLKWESGTPSPSFPRFLFQDSGEQVLVDVETKSNKEILEHVRKILGKSEETLQREQQERQQLWHPANFGPRKYCLRECMCQVEGQVPCPGLVALPKEMTGKYRAALRASAKD